MSIVNINAESVIGSIVDAMLPRYSDTRLGLYILFGMSMNDYGYGKDGNTKERSELSVQRDLHFIFVRSSNYTKVFFWENTDPEPGRLPDPRESKEPLVWDMVSDHDSCWREGFEHKLAQAYFDCAELFNGRKIGKEKLTPRDLSTYNTLRGDPKYVRLDVFERVNPRADRFSTEGRLHNIKFSQLSYLFLEKLSNNVGLCIKGSEMHKREIQNLDDITTP